MKTVLRFLRENFRQAQSPKVTIEITTIGTPAPIASLVFVIRLSGLVLDVGGKVLVGSDTVLNSVEDVFTDDRVEEKDESEGDDENGDEDDDP